jgi:hypothetical protein
MTKLHVVSWEEKMAPGGFHKRLKIDSKKNQCDPLIYTWDILKDS